jgi:hypothetical protein
MIQSQANQKDVARPRFFMDAIENPHRSKIEGRPIFDEVEMVEVKIPGDRLFVFHSPVEDKHRERWPELYAAFQRGEQRAAAGTPLEQWVHPSMTRSRVAELKACNILSVEELASVSDSILPRLGMGARALREGARAYIETAKNGAANAEMAAELASLKALVQQLQAAQNTPAEPATETAASADDAGARPIEDHTDEELRTYILRASGRQVRPGTPRAKLIAQATEIATAPAAAATE